MPGKAIKEKALSIEYKIKILKDIDIDSNSKITSVRIAKKLNILVIIVSGIVAKQDFILNFSDKSWKMKKKWKREIWNYERKHAWRNV